jgi:hydroxypyruvate isomerase
MPQKKNQISRRNMLQTGAGLLAATALTPAVVQAAETKKVIKNARIRQSIMGWTFNPMPTLELAQHCKDIGLVAMEGINSKFYPEVRKLGLQISLVGSHGFKDGPTDPKNHPSCIKKMKEGIDRAVEFDSKRVITFTGMRVDGLSDDQMKKNCLDCWKQVVPYAEKKGIMLCLEHLNSRDDSHPMKGHPGYFGDDVDFCVELIKAIDSPSFKLLFDIYHVQVMNGDVIRRIRQYKDLIGHYHTAGNPGRAELDDTQEINFPPILKEILKTGYDGFVAQEFIPTWDDKIKALKHAAKLCDV